MSKVRPIRTGRSPCAANVVIAEALETRRLLSSPSLWTSHGNGGGGNFLYPSIDPLNSAKLTVCSDMSGQYRSADGGASWALTDAGTFRAEPKVDNTVRYTALPGVALALNDRTLIYDFGSTPMRTNDDGVTWQRLPGWADVGSDAWSLFVDYDNPARVFISGYSNLYFSRDGGQTFAFVAGDKKNAQGQSVDNGLFVAGAVFDGSTIYVATASQMLGNRVFRSTDGGATFAPYTISGLDPLERIYSFAGARSGGGSGPLRLVAVAAGTSNGDWFPGVGQQDALRSFSALLTADNVGPGSSSAAWTRRINANAPTDPVRLGLLATTAANPQVVYCAGDDKNTTFGVVMKSVDGGATWTNVLHETGNHLITTGWLGDGGDLPWDAGGNIVGIAVSQGDPNALLIADYMGVHASNDGGAHWRQVYVNPADQNVADTTIPKRKAYRGNGLEDTSVWDLDFAGSGNATLLASYTDIAGRRSTDGGASWAAENFTASGTPNSTFSIAQAGNTFLAATSSVHDLYQDNHESVPGGSGLLLYSTDTGASWHGMYDFGAPVVWVAGEPGSMTRAYAAVVGAPGVGGIYRSDDVNLLEGNSWIHLPDPPGTLGNPYNIRPLGGNKLLASFGPRDLTPGASGVFYSPDGGLSWQPKLGNGAGAMSQRTKDVVPDPAAPLTTWFAAVRQVGSDTGGLFRTTNGGSANPTWTKIMPAVGVESITIGGEEAFVSTLSDGLWYSPDIHAAAPHFYKTDFPFAHPLRVFLDPAYATNHQIWVTSFGGGIWTGRTDAPLVVASAQHQYFTQPNHLRVTFNQDVIGTANLGSKFTVTRLTAPGGTVAISNFSYDPATRTASFDLPPALPDGNYRLTLPANSVNGPGAGSGATLATAFNHDFFVLAGDADRDRTVGPGDFNLLASHFGQTGQTWSTGDFDADGTVGPGDFNLLASRFGTTLAPPGGLAAATSTGATASATPATPTVRTTPPRSKRVGPAVSATSVLLRAAQRADRALA